MRGKRKIIEHRKISGVPLMAAEGNDRQYSCSAFEWGEGRGYTKTDSSSEYTRTWVINAQSFSEGVVEFHGGGKID